MKTSFRALIRSFLLLCALCLSPAFLRAADHGDSPGAANNASADLADVFFYLDPNDNSKAVLEMTVRGFIVPGEAVNMAIFDPDSPINSSSRELATRFLMRPSRSPSRRGRARRPRRSRPLT